MRTKPIHNLFKLMLLYYDRIDVSEGININKTSESKEYDVSHSWNLFTQRV